MDDFEKNRIWNQIDTFRLEIQNQGKCLARITQYIEDKEKSTNKKMTIFGLVFAGIAVGIAIFK